MYHLMTGSAFLIFAAAAVTPLGREYTNSIDMRFVRIEPGSFMMGQETGGDLNERPVHKVNITDSFYVSADGGQRLVLMRLREGPILFVSFTDSKGMIIRDASGRERRCYGLFAALSFDEGRTWPVKKLITAGDSSQELNGGAWTRGFTMDAAHAEPKGYMAATQTPDGVVHLISSRLHYQFNLAWLKMGS